MKKEQGPLVYEGKAKKVFQIQGEENLYWLEFKDSLTAFNGAKNGSFEGKGELNRNITSLAFRYLKKKGIQSHWVGDEGKTGLMALGLEIIPLEVVVRNRLAGSTAKKFQREEGEVLKHPLLELFYKNDQLQDPFINDEQAFFLETAKNKEELSELKKIAYQINKELKTFFEKVGLILVDFKLEFGRTPEGKILLGDEITPDTCRLWDKESLKKMDKDRFRRDLGEVKEAYEDVWSRLNKYWGASL